MKAYRSLCVAIAASCWLALPALGQTPSPPGGPPSGASRLGNAPPPDPGALAAAAQRMEALMKKPTPRTPEGRPDLTGLWFTYVMGSDGLAFDTQKSPDGTVKARLKRDPELFERFKQTFGPTQNPPQYKQEFQAKLKELQSGNMNRTDNAFTCGHPGVPRIGTPGQIVHTKDQVVFLYSDLAGYVFRVIPTDGRAHRDIDPTFYGDSVGRWDGDTLVVEAVGFVTDTWIGEDAFFHSDKLKVTERLKRVGETLHYDVTVEDTGVLTQPWVKPTRVLTLSQVPLEEPYPCDPRLAEKSFDTGRHDQRGK